MNVIRRGGKENKNAGGHPPALGESPNWETQVDYTATSCELLETHFTQLFKRPLLETAPAAKELLVGCSRTVLSEPDCGGFEAADVVCCLRQPILGSICGAIYNHIFRKHMLDGGSNCPLYRCLATIVINLHQVKHLQEFDMTKHEVYQGFTHRLGDLSRSAIFTHFEGKNRIANRKMAKENTKAGEQLGSRLKGKALISVVAIHQGFSMKWDAWKALVMQSPLIMSDRFIYGIALIVQNQGNEIAPISQIVATRLINKNAELSSHVASLKIKKPGKTSPALGSPFLRSDWLLYTTNRNVYSIVPKVEHMFYTIDTNICSPYRKAA